MAGFRKNGRTWLLKGKDVTCKVNLQKSSYDDCYYVNISFYLNQLLELDPEGNFHFHYRAENIFHDRRELIRAACHLAELSSPELLEQLAVFLETEMVPFLLACQDIKYLRKQFESGRMDFGLVSIEGRSYLIGHVDGRTLKN